MTFTILPESAPKTRRSAPPAVLIAVVVVAVLAVGGVSWALTRGSGHPVAAPASTVAAARPHPAEPRSAQQWLTAALSSARKQGSVHLELIAHLPGRTLSYSDDDGRNNGVQRISVTPAMHAQVRVVGSTTYFAANRAALLNYFGFPAKTANKDANHWLVLRPGDPGYSEVTDGVTLASALTQVEVRAPLTLLPSRTLLGERVVGVQGTGDQGSTATLWIRSTGSHLPVAYQANSPKRGTVNASFMRWSMADVVTGPPVDSTGAATTGAQCSETPPPGASAQAVAYVEAVQAGVAQWVAIDKSLNAEFGEVHLDDLRAEAQADSAFLSRLRAIHFTGPAVQYANGLENVLREYVRLMATASNYNGYLSQHQAEDNSLLHARSVQSSQLRTVLGLPQSTCTFLRP